MVWLRSMDGKRGMLGAAVALALLLSSGLLGLKLITAPVTGPVGAAGPTPPDAPAARTPDRPSAALNPPPRPAVPTAPGAGSAAPLSQLPPAVAATLQREGLTASVWAASDVPDCATNSSGETQAFLRRRPCEGMRRALLDVKGPGPGEALVAVAWVRMPTGFGAGQLKALIDRPGSGNINSLNPSVPFTGQYYASRVDATTAINADVHPLVPGMTPAQLKAIAAACLG